MLADYVNLRLASQFPAHQRSAVFHGQCRPPLMAEINKNIAVSNASELVLGILLRLIDMLFIGLIVGMSGPVIGYFVPQIPDPFEKIQNNVFVFKFCRDIKFHIAGTIAGTLNRQGGSATPRLIKL